MQKFERAHFEIKEYNESEHYGKFVFEPLERGFGTTIGNALRRVLLSSLPGVDTVEKLGKASGGAVSFRVVSEDTDVRRELFTRLADRNWPIMGLSSSSLTLEQIFLRLTDETFDSAAALGQKKKGDKK